MYAIRSYYGKAVFVHVERLEQPLHRGELILRVEDLKLLRQPGIAMVGAQHAVTQAA